MVPAGRKIPSPGESFEQVLAAAPLIEDWEVIASVDSTQRRARDRAAAGEAHVLILAEEQTLGHGRRGSPWFSPRGGGLWISVVLAPHRPLEVWPLLTSLCALAMRRALREVAGITAGLKWPNDLFCSGRKIAGFLAEVIGTGARARVVLGAGLNTGQAPEDFPPELRGLATSVRIETGRRSARPRLLRAFLEALADELERFEAGEEEAIRADLREASLYLGRRLCIVPESESSPEKGSFGRVTDIGPLGELILAPVRAEAPAPGDGSPLSEPVHIMSGRVAWVDPPLGEEC